MKYVTVLTIRDLFTKVSSPLGSSFERSAGSIPVRCTKEESILLYRFFFTYANSD